MVEETLFRELNVPTQAWLKRHTAWYEEEVENYKAERMERLKTAVVAVLAVVLIVETLLLYGGY